jgi:hypothetical protein
MKQIPSQEYLLSVLDYDPETGVLRWKTRADMPPKLNGRYAGKVAGTVKPSTYGHRLRVIALTNKGGVFRAHRIIWKMVHGVDPLAEIDHANGDPLDNRLCNLREATHQQNMCNRKPKRKNKGAYFHGRSGRWRASIMVSGREISLGYFKTPEAAHEAYVHAAHEHHGEFAGL